MSKRFEIALRPPLPTTEKALRERIIELQEAEQAIREEMAAIRHTGRITQTNEFDCLRCGHHWKPKRVFFNEPKRCPKCKSDLWRRPRQKVKIVPQTVEVVIPAAVGEFPPPPPMPMSLSERLAALRQPEPEPVVEPEVEAT